MGDSRNPAMVARATTLATQNLSFFVSLDQAVDWLGTIDLVDSYGAIQYTDDPSATVDALCSLLADAMLWKRLALTNSNVERRLQVTRLADNGPGKLDDVSDKDVVYCETSIPEKEFLSRHVGYRLVERDGSNFRFEKMMSE
jgi:hypothetical protein